MHLRSAVDIFLALLFLPKPSPFAALLERNFWTSVCFDGERHNLLSDC
jgi:hypothetical protein